MTYIFLILMLFVSTQPMAEDAPNSPAVPAIPGNEILLFDIKNLTDGKVELGPGKNITNQPGYDSQPKFSLDGSIVYYTHAVSSDSGFQMDIYQYDVRSGKTQPYLVTRESEYSPTPRIHGDGLSVVQVDEHGDQYVVLLDKQDEPGQQAKRYSDLKQIGYFNWTADGSLWSFVLNDNSGGDLYRQGKDLKGVQSVSNIGRAFITDQSNKHLYFVDKNSSPWRIKSSTADSKTPEDVMALPMGVEDFTLDSKGRFWAGRDNTLYVSTDQQRWFIAHEFNDPMFHQITRVTTNPNADQIAIVFAEKSNKE